MYRRYPSKVDLVVEGGRFAFATDEMTFPDTGNLSRTTSTSMAQSLVNAFKNKHATQVMPVMTYERRRYPELDAGSRRFLADRKARTTRCCAVPSSGASCRVTPTSE